MILHITKRTEWERAASSRVYVTASFRDERFIHCSTPDQVVRVADFLFGGQSGLILLCIDEGRLAAEIRHENLEGGQELFPHIYGAINMDAVVEVFEFEPETDGSFRLPSEIRKTLG